MLDDNVTLLHVLLILAPNSILSKPLFRYNSGKFYGSTELMLPHVSTHPPDAISADIL